MCVVFSRYFPHHAVLILILSVKKKTMQRALCVRLLPSSSFFSVVSFNGPSRLLLSSSSLVPSRCIHILVPRSLVSSSTYQRVGTDNFCPLVRINGSPRKRCRVCIRCFFFRSAFSPCPHHDDALIRWFGCRVVQVFPFLTLLSNVFRLPRRNLLLSIQPDDDKEMRFY